MILPCILCSMTDDGLGWFGPAHVRELWWLRPNLRVWQAAVHGLELDPVDGDPRKP